MEGLFHTQRGAPCDSGTAGRGEQRLDNPLTIPRGLSFLTYQIGPPTMEAWTDFRETMARPYRIGLFQLSHHGGPGNNFIAIFFCRVVCFRDALFRRRGDAVGDDAFDAASVHRQSGRMDNSGGGAPTLAGLWNDADIGGTFTAGIRGEYMVHADRLYGDVHGAGDSVFISGLPRNRGRA